MNRLFMMRVGVAATLLLQPVADTLAQSVASQPSVDRTKEIRQAVIGGRARNVILFLGDGMGDSEITIARNYYVGANGRLALDSFPLTGEYTTYALQESNPSLPDYVTDSAASGTGWSTGQKTSNGRISTVAGSVGVAPITTILELAQSAGYAVGDVSTADLTDATPAVLASHVNDRDCGGPADMSTCSEYKKSNGGPGSIAEQEVDHHVDVLLGGGYSRFAQTIDGGVDAGKTVLQSAQRQGYTIVRTVDQLRTTVPGQRVLGLFANGNMSLEWSGQLAQPFPGSGPQTCLEDQRPANQPSLAEMTSTAISLLDRARVRGNGGGRSGFFLQVEGASIDKQDHVSNPCGQIGETIAFDRAIAVGLEYAKTHPDTLIVVTADHGHTSQIISSPSSSAQPGAFSVLKTKDGANMTVSYATAPVGASQSHTGTQVRIAAQGPQAANVSGVTNQTDLFYTMGRALGLIQDQTGQ